MDRELKDTVAIVVGASKGLGRACALVPADEGVKVTVCSRAKAGLDGAAQAIRDASGTEVLAFAGDLDEPETIRALAEFLASGRSSYITGTTILVDGGLVPPVL